MTLHPYTRLFAGNVINPTSNDDSSLGYEVGDVWVNQSGLSVFQAVDVTISGAIWVDFVEEAPNNGTTYGRKDGAWTTISGTAASGITDHALLSNLNSANYYHLTQTQYTDLTDGGDTTLHTHTFSGGGHTIKDEGTSLPARTYLNFIGSGVYAVDNPGADSTDVTISGASVIDAANVALGIIPTYSPSPSASYSDFGPNSYMTEADSDYGTATSASKVTDGYRTLAVEAYNSGRYIAWQQQDSTIQFNLGSAKNVRQVRAYGLLDSGVSIYRPSSIEVKRSSDGVSWTSVISKTSLTAGTGTKNWIIVLNFSPTNYQYWQVIIGKPTVGGSWHFVGEVELRTDSPT